MSSRKPATTPITTASHTSEDLDQAIDEGSQRIVEIRAHYAAAVESGDGAAMWRARQDKKLLDAEMAELVAASTIRRQQAVVQDLEDRLAAAREAAAAAKRDAEEAIDTHKKTARTGGANGVAARKRAEAAMQRSAQMVHVVTPIQMTVEVARQELRALIAETARRIG